MKLHEMKYTEGARQKSYRVGRGHGSGNGKTAGKGHKGQKARSDYERVKLLYDWIIDRSDYVNKEENNQNMLSVFLDKKAVCAGYSKSFKYLLDQLHIPNAIILEYPEIGRAHV